MTAENFGILKEPEVTYILHMTDSLQMEMTGKPPFFPHRFMMWAYFGWKFEVFKKSEDKKT